jgi:hypothetical protein
MEHVKNTITQAIKTTVATGVAFEYLIFVDNLFSKAVSVRGSNEFGIPFDQRTSVLPKSTKS